MKTEIIKRTFEAAKYPVGSTERNALNDSAITSEYMTSKKYLAVIHNPETSKSFAYKNTYSCTTKKEAEDIIKQAEIHATYQNT